MIEAVDKEMYLLMNTKKILGEKNASNKIILFFLVCLSPLFLYLIFQYHISFEITPKHFSNHPPPQRILVKMQQ